jgi:potassium uptake TrkH family protein
MLEISPAERAARRNRMRHPAQLVAGSFLVVIVGGTLLLLLPGARAEPGSAPLLVALFTATSAVCVTGLIVVDTPTYWSGFGQVVILVLIQVGGFGIMTFASLLGLLVSRRLGMSSRLNPEIYSKSVGGGDVRTVLLGVAKVSVLCEAVVALILTLRLFLAYDEPLPRAGYLGVFHAVSAFNNAGFALYSDSLVRFVTDPWVCLPVVAAVILGGLGFPVVLELARELRGSRRFSMHTKLVLASSGALLGVGTVFLTANEWRNPDTLGGLAAGERVLAGFTSAVMPRTAGFNTVDIGAMRESSWLGTEVLMFIGGAPAGTAGGIKITTFTVLMFVIWAELRADRHVNVFDRMLSHRLQRQALTVALLGIACVVLGAWAVLEMSDFATSEVMFEVVSAFGTVGLSTGITGELPAGAQLVLVLLMFVGRVGPVTLVSGLALRESGVSVRYPEGRPLIG